MCVGSQSPLQALNQQQACNNPPPLSSHQFEGFRWCGETSGLPRGGSGGAALHRCWRSRCLLPLSGERHRDSARLACLRGCAVADANISMTVADTFLYGGPRSIWHMICSLKGIAKQINETTPSESDHRLGICTRRSSIDTLLIRITLLYISPIGI